MANPTNPLAQSSQAGLAPQGDASKQYAVRRLAKQQMRQGRQTPGRVTGPPKLMPLPKY